MTANREVMVALVADEFVRRFVCSRVRAERWARVAVAALEAARTT